MVPFVLVSWGGVRMSPHDRPATNRPILPAPDAIWSVWSSQWNNNWQGKPNYSEETCPSSTLSTTNSRWPDLGLIPGERGGKSTTNRLGYGAADIVHLLRLLTCCYKANYISGTILHAIILYSLSVDLNIWPDQKMFKIKILELKYSYIL
jgi:hypothetical protein